MRIKRVLLAKETCDGELIPKGYGIAYYEHFRDLAVCYPLGLHWVVNILRRLYWTFRVLRPNWWERQLRRAEMRGYERGRKFGYERGKAEWYERGVLDGRIIMLKELNEWRSNIGHSNDIEKER